MEDELIRILESLGFKVIRQGSLAPDEEYPPTFFTFWNTDEGELTAYDNDTVLTYNDFSVYVYSNDPSTAYSALDSARDALKAAGWIIETRGFDVASDEITHIGRGMDVTFIRTI